MGHSVKSIVYNTFSVLLIWPYISNADDIFETFKPNEAYPQELNTFLSNVFKYRDDFRLISQAAENLRAKKESEFEDSSNLFPLHEEEQRNVRDLQQNLDKIYTPNAIDNNERRRRNLPRSNSNQATNNLKETRESNKTGKRELNLNDNFVHKTKSNHKERLYNKDVSNDSSTKIQSIDLKRSIDKFTERRLSKDNDGFETVVPIEIVPKSTNISPPLENHNYYYAKNGDNEEAFLRQESISDVNSRYGLETDLDRRPLNNYLRYSWRDMPSYNKDNPNIDSQRNVVNKRHLKIKYPGGSRYRQYRQPIIRKPSSNPHYYHPHEKYRQSRQIPKFIRRKLQYVDENAEHSKSNTHRIKRDIAKTLGMSNEEDYKDDNPYMDSLFEKSGNCSHEKNLQELTKGNLSTKHQNSYTTQALLSSSIPIYSTTLSTQSQINEGRTKTLEDNLKFLIGKREPGRELSVKDFDDINEDRIIRETSRNSFQKLLLENQPKIRNSNNEDIINRGKRAVRSSKLRRAANSTQLDNAMGLERHNVEKKEDSSCPSSSNCPSSDDDEENTTEQPVTETSKVIEHTTIEMKKTTIKKITLNVTASEHIHDPKDNFQARVDTAIASKLIDCIFNQVKQAPTLKRTIGRMLRRKYPNAIDDINFNPDAGSPGNVNSEVAESNALIDQLGNTLNQIIANQITEKRCQKLPEELKQFLNVITSYDITEFSKKSNNEEANSPPNDFLFDFPVYSDSSKNTELKNARNNLDELLRQFHSMDTGCQSHAEPVRDYIEDHLKLLQSMAACHKHIHSHEKPTAAPVNEKDLIEQQLESLGLGNKHSFVPNFDVNRMVKDQIVPDKTKRSIPNLSVQFKKLEDAVENIRKRRDSDKKIAELFGNTKADRSTDKFEKPLVSSLT